VSAVRVEYGQVRVDLADRKTAGELAWLLGLAPVRTWSQRQRIWHGRKDGTPVTITCLGEPGCSVTDEATARLLADLRR
jgi:hypothetical protein